MTRTLLAIPAILFLAAGVAALAHAQQPPQPQAQDKAQDIKKEGPVAPEQGGVEAIHAAAFGPMAGQSAQFTLGGHKLARSPHHLRGHGHA